MEGPQAVTMLLAIGLQESGFATRRQYGNGPARGLWQFELGTQAGKGGIWGIYLHSASREHLRALCGKRGVVFEPGAIYRQLEHDDVLAAACARLLLWTDPAPLPELGSPAASWNLYARTWRPGKPHPEKWPSNYAKALEVVRWASGQG
ncbi:hypothetical protein D3C76_581250 [compost metagenome]